MASLNIEATVSGSFRRASLTAEAVPIPLTRHADGSFQGTGTVRIEDNDVRFALMVVGEPGSTYTLDLVMGEKEVTRKGILKKDVVVRGFTVPL